MAGKSSGTGPDICCKCRALLGATGKEKKCGISVQAKSVVSEAM